jgi:predicted DNA binding CopG/RHH family protein
MGRKPSKSLKKELFYNEDAREAPELQFTEEELKEQDEINKKVFEANAKEAQEELADKQRINIWISNENVEFLRMKARHSGSNVASLCSIAVSDYCDEQRLKFGSLYKNIK